MHLSTHYFVLSLGAVASQLYEAFRDCLVEIEDHGFPFIATEGSCGSCPESRLRILVSAVDGCLSHHYRSDSPRLILVGEKDAQSAFAAVTTHRNAVIGNIEGDHSMTSTRDLGQIVWPVVKEAMTGVMETAMRALEASERQGRLASGLEAMLRLLDDGHGGTMLVEDDYRARGSIGGPHRSPLISTDVDLRDLHDDAVDAVIDRVLAFGGNVVFMPTGSLNERSRAVLLLRDRDNPGY